MKRLHAELALVFSLSFVVRIILFYPSFVQGGDLGQFATFVREMNLNGSLIPSSNSLYFPGTQYIYPPLSFLLTNGITSVIYAQFNPYGVMKTLLILGAAASSGTATLIYGLSRSGSVSVKNFICGAVVVFFTPDLYALSWGGDPSVIGEFLFILFLTFLLQRKPGKERWIIGSSLTLILIAFTHDLTWFFAILALLVLTIYDLTKNGPVLALRDIIPLASGLLAGLIWWLPRVAFVLDALGASGSSGYGSLNPVSSAQTYLIAFLPFAFAIVSMAVYSLYRSNIKLSKIKWDPFVLAMFSSFIFLIFLPKSPTLAARILYFGIITSTIVVMRMFADTSGPVGGKRPAGYGKGKLALPILILVVIVAATLPLQFANAHSSTNYYKSGYYQYDPELLTWGETHLDNGTVVAPNIGNYIAAVDGAPVIVYGNFLVGGTQIMQRDIGIQIVTNPASSSSLQYLSEYDITYVVVSTSYLNSSNTTFPGSLYSEIYSDNYYVVEMYKGTG